MNHYQAIVNWTARSGHDLGPIVTTIVAEDASVALAIARDWMASYLTDIYHGTFSMLSLTLGTGYDVPMATDHTTGELVVA